MENNSMSMLIQNYITEKFIKNKKTRFEFGSFILPITDLNFIKYLNSIQSIMKKIDSKHIVQFEKEPHITILGGIKSTVQMNDIKIAFKKIKPQFFYVDVQDLMIFKKNHDVITFKCNANSLYSIHRKLSDLPHIKLHPSFIPHITIAYVKSGEGEKYMNIIKKYHKNGKIKINAIQFSDPMGTKWTYRLLDNKANDNVSQSK